MTDYDKLYARTRNALGEPSVEIRAYFGALPGSKTVLDIGCGQGRDALMAARLGHKITAIDASKAGIAQLRGEAAREGLAITTICADIRAHVYEGTFDVLLIDRTLHMLAPEEAELLFTHLLSHVDAGSHLLLVDEPRNIPAFREIVEKKFATTPLGVGRGKKGFYCCELSRFNPAD